MKDKRSRNLSWQVVLSPIAVSRLEKKVLTSAISAALRWNLFIRFWVPAFAGTTKRHRGQRALPHTWSCMSFVILGKAIAKPEIAPTKSCPEVLSFLFCPRRRMNSVFCFYRKIVFPDSRLFLESSLLPSAWGRGHSWQTAFCLSSRTLVSQEIPSASGHEQAGSPCRIKPLRHQSTCQSF